MKQSNYRIGAVAGYQQTRFSWMSFGGHYEYQNGKYIGDFPPGERFIGYSQKFIMPYAGMAGSYRYRNFEFNTLFKFSRWVNAKDNDEHYMNKETFRSKTSNSNYHSVTVDTGYFITPGAKVFTEFTWSRYSQSKGDSLIINRASGDVSYGQIAGLENRNLSVSTGIQYRF